MFFRSSPAILVLAIAALLLYPNSPTAWSATPAIAAEPAVWQDSAVDVDTLSPDDEPLGDPPSPPPSSNKPPKVVNFSGRRDSPGVWVLSGKVEDEKPAGLTVRFGGLNAAKGYTAITDANGNFTITIDIGNVTGEVWARTTDAEGLESNYAYWDII